MEKPTASQLDLRAYSSDSTSQHGENGIISAIFSHIGATSRRCVEFGAYELGVDSNVYPLWRDEGWGALLIEGSPDRASKISRDYARLQSSANRPKGSVTIVCQYVEPSGPRSLDVLLDQMGWQDDVDLCVIDVDGMDYHIFAGLACKPRVLMCEFNASIPVHINVVGSATGNYLGCSALALFELGRRKGYSLVACTKVNCIFVRDDLAEGFILRNDLPAMFDSFAVTYLMTAYDGSVFLSRPPLFASNLLSPQAANHLGEQANNLWVPFSRLSTTYLATRSVFSVLQRVAPGLARRLLSVVRVLRHRTGSALFGPPPGH